MKRLTAVLVIAALVAWGAGFAWFAQVAGTQAPPPPPADGIVVLTGGADRVATGLRLLRQGAAPRLLVSGVAPGTSKAALTRTLDPAGNPDPIDDDRDRRLASHITLGDAAISTHGNAREALDWVHRYDMRSLIVVTAYYHMPRALAELKRALPGTALYPSPVQPAALSSGSAAIRIGLLAKEYTKWLAVRMDMPRYAPAWIHPDWRRPAALP